MKSSIVVRSFWTLGVRSGGLHYVGPLSQQSLRYKHQKAQTNLVICILQHQQLPLIEMLHTLLPTHKLDHGAEPLASLIASK